MNLLELLLVIALTIIAIGGVVDYFQHEQKRVAARSEKSVAMDAADAYWRSTYSPQPIESECIDADKLDSDMMLYYGDPCTITVGEGENEIEKDGFRVHQILDCSNAHAKMNASGEDTVSLLDGAWELILQEGRLSGEIVHQESGVRFDYRRPDIADEFGEVLRDEVNFPTQRYGELFTSTLAGPSDALIVYRPQTDCLSTL